MTNRLNAQVSTFGTLLIASCICVAQAAVPLATPEQDRRAKQAVPGKDTALLFLYREERDGPAELTVHVNRRFMTRTEPRTFMVLSLRAGRHMIASDARETDAIWVVAQPGQSYYVRQSARPPGWPGIAQFSFTAQPAGAAAIARSRLIDVRAAQAAEATSATAKPVPSPAPAAKPPVTAQKLPPVPPPPRPSPVAERPPVFAFTAGSGKYSLSRPSQTLAGVDGTFDKTITGLYSLRAEWRPTPGIGVGAEAFGFKGTFYGPSPTESTMAVSGGFATVRKFFGDSRSLRPFLGAGVGGVQAKFDGSAVTGSISGPAGQIMLGLEMQWGPAVFVLEGRYLSARTRDKVKNYADLSGRGIFGGLGLAF